MTKATDTVKRDLVALALVNEARARHNIPIFNSTKDMIEYLTKDALLQYRCMANAAIGAIP